MLPFIFSPLVLIILCIGYHQWNRSVIKKISRVCDSWVCTCAYASQYRGIWTFLKKKQWHQGYSLLEVTQLDLEKKRVPLTPFKNCIKDKVMIIFWMSCFRSQLVSLGNKTKLAIKYRKKNHSRLFCYFGMCLLKFIYLCKLDGPSYKLWSWGCYEGQT